MSVDEQPLSTVEWVDPSTLHANGWNPNHVAPPEMRLLKLSIIENGWTQPIVALLDGTVIDGFHRWTLGTKDADVRNLTGGLVPVVRLRNVDAATQRIATVRHNRARGTHGVLPMADIVADLTSQGLEAGEIARRLQMDPEEVDRLLDRGNMTKRGRTEDFGVGWEPE